MHSLIKTTSLGVIFLAALIGCGGTNNAQPAGTAGAGGTDTTGAGGSTTGAGGDGTGAGGAAGAPQTTSGSYQPLVINATWTYHVDDHGTKYDKVNKIETLEDMGGMKAGVMAYRERSTLPAEVQLTWYQTTPTGVVRYHDQSMDTGGALKTDDWYDPFKLRVDETPDHLTAGAAWSSAYVDTRTSRSKPTAMVMQTDSWKVEAVDEPITVAAGTFSALRVTQVDAADGSTKTFWFVRGVGKVREQTNAGHTEELASYNIPQ